MPGSAIVFINYLQAARFGHIGWGFLLEDGASWCYGSTDHLWRKPWFDVPGWIAYSHVPEGSNNDWWMEIGDRDQMMSVMTRSHHIYYHAYKQVAANAIRPEAAIAAAKSMRSAGWSLVANNCVHQTYRILTDYGAVLPRPKIISGSVVPSTWFAQIKAESEFLVTGMHE